MIFSEVLQVIAMVKIESNQNYDQYLQTNPVGIHLNKLIFCLSKFSG